MAHQADLKLGLEVASNAQNEVEMTNK